MSLRLTRRTAHSPNSLSSWPHFQTLVKQGQWKAFGFSGSLQDLYFFANRYRFAKSYRGLDLEGYSDLTDTQEGYSGLNRVLLCYSTFEQFKKIIGNQKAVRDDYNTAASLVLLEGFEKIDNFRLLIEYLNNHSRDRIKKYLSQYLSGQQPLRILSLAAALRHIYSHGILSSSPQGFRTKDIIGICNSISMHLLEYMDDEFTKKVCSISPK